MLEISKIFNKKEYICKINNKEYILTCFTKQRNEIEITQYCYTGKIRDNETPLIFNWVDCMFFNYQNYSYQNLLNRAIKKFIRFNITETIDSISIFNKSDLLFISVQL